ncbi:MAG: Gfo/Idh/MocA family oxidoreductase [Candidatus Moranbacteria bacterium]|jgi:scyllo-inositol 2-dehydrogenase (NADP+)|nr:Gfo/Idh/MocA family oxidoreductase [Candidatus Moranbacteria bacterium]
MLQKQKVRVGIIGGGWVTEHRHLPVLARHASVEITSLVGRDRKRVESLQKKFSIQDSFVGAAQDFPQGMDACEAVVIGADPSAHASLIRFALEQGKHVLVEKPFTLSVHESEELVDLARARGLKLAVVHNFQFSSSARELERDILQGNIGTIRSVEAVQLSNPKRRLPSWYESLPWGLFFDESPHLLYLLERFGGPLAFQSAAVHREEGRETPQLVDAFFLGKGGMPITLHMNFNASVSEWFLIVHGEKRVGVLDIFRDIYFSLPNDGRHAPQQILRTSSGAFFGHLKGVFRSGIQVLRGTYFCGNESVMDIFFRSILENSSLGSISAEKGVSVNRLQSEIINRASLY